ncbi:MAG: phage holin family protein [Candidatus Pacebacteria bacterium]|nr:phage holin family protein [Candidatus Paceibacterota bacterium]
MTIIHWIVSVVAILIAAYLVPGVHVTLLGAIVLAVVLGVFNIFLKPIITILTLPVTILTLGLFSLVINALLVMLADLLIPDFSLGGFWIALLFALVLSLVNGFFHFIIRKS